MKKVLSVFCVVLVLVGCAAVFSGCTQADRVSQNVSQDADNFNVIRRLVVINGRTDVPVFELVAAFSFELEETAGNRRIIAVAEVGDGVYAKHSVGLPHEAFWFVEDISGASVSKYHYEVNFLPDMIIPIEFVSKD